jgi:hypothetical protein
LASFEDQILLLDYQLAPSNEGLVVELWWHSLEVPERDITLFAHAIDSEGQLVAQADGYPLQGLSPPMRWLPGDQIHDIRYIVLPEDFDPTQLTLLVGWYDTTTGDRLTATDQNGQPIPSDAVPLMP